jgi:hypothetical protein
MYKNKYLKHLLVIFTIIFFIFLAVSSASSPPPKVPLFRPLSNEYVEVRMYNGKLTAFIENSDFSFLINANEDTFNDGMITFFVGMQNNMNSGYLQLRYSNFRLYYTNKDGVRKHFNKSCTFDEWVNWGYRSNYVRDRMRVEFRNMYLMENDIRPNGGNSFGIIAFPYDGYTTFELTVTIMGREYIIRFS